MSSNDSMQALIDKANSAWTTADAAASKAACASRGAQSSPAQSMLADSMVSDKSLAAVKLHAALSVYWQKDCERFTAVWAGMTPASRRALITAVSPYTPRYRGDKDAGGEKGASHGISLLAPELNLRDLCDGAAGFPALITSCTEYLEELYMADRDMTQALVQERKLRLDDSRRNEWAFLTGASHVGASMKATGREGIAQLQNFERMGAAVPCPLFSLMLERRFSIMQLCALVIDEVREHVFSGSGGGGGAAAGTVRPHKMLSSTQVCLQCGAGEAEGGGALKVCQRCKLATYCCREHQVQHWKDSHKHDCGKH